MTHEDSGRIDLPGGWYFRKRQDTETGWFALYRPDGISAPSPSSWYEHEARAFAAALTSPSSTADAPSSAQPSEPVTLPYTNWRGETADREITPTGRLLFTSNEWHPAPQWLVEAFDHVKGEVRLFALSGFGKPAQPSEPDAPPVDLVARSGNGWQPIESAPKDRLIIVYAPGSEFDLTDIVCGCQWYDDAGFCVDELRYPTLWQEFPAPPSPDALRSRQERS